MEPIVGSTEMRTFDRFAIESLGVQSTILMENAGRNVVAMMEKHFGSLSGKSVLIVCGKGNNGGDGFVAARHLHIRKANVSVLLTSSPSELKGDPLANFQILKKLQKKSSSESQISFLTISSLSTLSPSQLPEFIIDAIFGTGFTGGIEGKYLKLVEWINQQQGKKISIDIPSGVNADTGEVVSSAVKADLTVTMGMKKIGLLCGDGRTHSGNIEVVDIGVPQQLPPTAKFQTFLIESNDVRLVLPTRAINAHKHSVGKIFVLAGSPGMTGAAAMAAQSAMRVGAGSVILGAPKSIYQILARKLTEVMVDPLEGNQEGTISEKAIAKIRKHIEWADVVVIGPGLSRNLETQELIQKLVAECSKPMLIDADGLNALAMDISILKKINNKNIILTPHVGEFSRISKINSGEIEKNRVQVAREFAKNYKLTLILKGAPTVTASASGIVFMNSSGNPGMATAGSGDVLSGAIAGLWGQGMNSFDAAYAGVYIHGLAGDLSKEKFGEKGLLAMDILESIPQAMRQIEAEVA